MKYFYNDKFYITQGPISLDELRSLYQDYLIGDNTLIFQEGESEWKELSSLGLTRTDVIIEDYIIQDYNTKKSHLFPHRLVRTAYLGRVALIHLFLLIIPIVLAEVIPAIEDGGMKIWIYVVFLILYCLSFPLSALMPRMRDIGFREMDSFGCLDNDIECDARCCCILSAK